MGAGTILTDLFALAAIVAGMLMAFRQGLVRAWWTSLIGKRPRTGPAPQADGDPARYALIIFGMMLLAFGLIIFSFFTAYALLT